MTILLIGLGLIFGSVFSIARTFKFAIIMDTDFIPAEEMLLQEQFNEEFKS